MSVGDTSKEETVLAGENLAVTMNECNEGTALFPCRECVSHLCNAHTNHHLQLGVLHDSGASEGTGASLVNVGGWEDA